MVRGVGCCFCVVLGGVGMMVTYYLRRVFEDAFA